VPLTGAVGTNGLVDSKETVADNGIVNYTSTYSKYALSKPLSVCADTDGDSIGDLVDIDDDNDGVIDAVECPTCYATAIEAADIASITSELDPYLTNVPANAIDSSATTYSAFDPSINWVGKELFRITPSVGAIKITGIDLDLINWAISNGAANTFKLQGSTDGTTWTDLSGNLASTATTGTFNVPNTLQPNTAYSIYRLVGVAGTSYYGGVTDMRLVIPAGFQASLYPKAVCTTDTDGDGINNNLDLDSDGDGCSDAYEAGATTTKTANYAFPIAGVGTNGLANSLETVADNGIANYTATYQYASSNALNACLDSDNDGISNVVDIDDDNDGVLDTVEADCNLLPPAQLAAFVPNFIWDVAVYNGAATNTSPKWGIPGSVVATATYKEYPNSLEFDISSNGNGGWVNAGNAKNYLQTWGGVTDYVGANTGINFTISFSHTFSAAEAGTYTFYSNQIADGLQLIKYSSTGVETILYSKYDTWSVPSTTSLPTITLLEGDKLVVWNDEYGVGNTSITLRTTTFVPANNVNANCGNLIDTDNDGTPNYLDTDSDGDGCSDAFEAGATTNVLPYYTFPANQVGANGLANSLETATESGLVNYTVTYSKAIDSTIHTCPSCLAGNFAPNITQTTATNICPGTITTASIAGLTNTGTAPVGTKLVWSTNKVPTSAGDTLTNLTTISTAGKYYALYYDKYNNCYSPADSVTVSFITCTASCVASTTAPNITQTTITNTCPTETVSLVSLTNAGTKPAGSTLVWSTHKELGYAGDTLTNLTSVSNAGKYYALYYDKANNCYSPADSVTFNSTDCTLPPLPAVSTVCDYSAAPASVTLNISAEPVGYSKTYLLVDMTNGKIVQVNPTTLAFTNVNAGNYMAIAAYYSGTLNNAVVDMFMKDIYVNGAGNCLKYSAPYVFKVCGTCDFNTAPATISFTAIPSSTAGVTTTYVLIDGSTNKIIQTSASSTFSGVAVGDYSVVAVYTNGASTLAVGDTLYQKVTNDPLCLGVSNSITYKVCNTACLAGTVAPAITPTTATNTCPVATVDLTALANTGTKPVGTSLIWSTHKVPTSAADTLSNLTTVSTAGKYYAMYYDAVNACYSPADSVEATITTCNLSPVISSGLTATTPENVSTSTPVYTATATDPNLGQSLTFSFEAGGVDNGLFTINPTTGAVTFNASPDFENPTDAGANNIYDIKVKVCDNGIPVLCDTIDVAITITNTVECLAATTAPAITETTVTNTCPTTTFSLAALTNTGTIPAGTTLVWSTNKVPTSAADTLTNLITVVTAGKYYAIYYDAVNNCYSPADSVVSSLSPCILANPNMVNAAVGTPLTINVLDNDTNNGSMATLSNVTAPVLSTLPTHGTATVNLDGTINYTPTAGYSGPDTLIYTVCDLVQTTVCDTAMVVINVACPTVTAPTLSASAVSNTCPQTTVEINLLETSTPPSGTLIEWYTNSSHTGAQYGTPVSAGVGTYYGFYKTLTGCYSAGTPVTVTINNCGTVLSCEAGLAAPILIKN
jgi:Bacterial Ig domain/Cadherin domain